MDLLKKEVESINEYSQSSTQSALEISKASSHLHDLTNKLDMQVSKFKVQG